MLNISKIKKNAFIATTSIVLPLALTSQANAVSLIKSSDGISVDAHGIVSAWAINSDWDNGSNQENAFRLMSGFNPSNVEFLVAAPEYNGLSISGNFQIDVHINGPKQRSGEVVQFRRASMDITSDVGTFQIGRDLGIFGRSGVLNDPGSLNGVGYVCGGSDKAGGTCGRIGTGYTWTDFGPGVRYFSPEISNFSLSIGIFDPTESDNSFETSGPAFEMEITYKNALQSDSDNLSIWLGGFHQGIKSNAFNASTNIKGVNIGARLKLNNLGFTVNAESTEGIAEGFHGVGTACNALGCDSVNGDQWYALVDYTSGDTLYGLSYGEGSDEENVIVGNDNVDRDLLMVFALHKLTPNLNVNFEYSQFERKTDGSGTSVAFDAQEKYYSISVGAEYRF